MARMTKVQRALETLTSPLPEAVLTLDQIRAIEATLLQDRVYDNPVIDLTPADISDPPPVSRYGHVGPPTRHRRSSQTRTQ